MSQPHENLAVVIPKSCCHRWVSGIQPIQPSSRHEDTDISDAESSISGKSGKSGASSLLSRSRGFMDSWDQLQTEALENLRLSCFRILAGDRRRVRAWASLAAETRRTGRFVGFGCSLGCWPHWSTASAPVPFGSPSLHHQDLKTYKDLLLQRGYHITGLSRGPGRGQGSTVGSTGSTWMKLGILRYFCVDDGRWSPQLIFIHNP